MCHHIQSLDRIFRYDVGNGRFCTGQWIMERANAATFVDSESPAMRVDIGVAAAAFESPKREVEIRGRGTVHTQKLTHIGRALFDCNCD
mmetsp:Transcript_38902/g.81371  ORF Transcript_38902/g.81371 Transcript_38902/m.81371 type:complete len:89 (-) Transcript_38902:183-449(-)